MAERRRELVFYDPHNWQVQDVLAVPDCRGVDHADFTPDGRTAVFTCEFAGRVAVVDVAAHRLLRMIDMPVRNTRMGPQDIKLAPDGSVFYVADHDQGGVWVLDGAATRVLREIPTGHGTHGLYLSRDASKLYVTNRHAGTVSVLDAYTGAEHRLRARRLHRRRHRDLADPRGRQPGHGQRDRRRSRCGCPGWDRAVYVLSRGRRSVSGRSPSGRAARAVRWPQPGRYSLGTRRHPVTSPATAPTGFLGSRCW